MATAAATAAVSAAVAADRPIAEHPAGTTKRRRHSSIPLDVG
jgi:hypothetical protein